SGVLTLPADFAAPGIPLVIETPHERLGDLYALLTQPFGRLALTDSPTREAVCEAVSFTLDGYGPADTVVDLKVLLRVPGAFWRDILETTSVAVALATAT